MNRAVIVERRRAWIVAHLNAADSALAGERWDEAQEEIEQAALLNPDDERVHRALERIDAVRTARQVDEHVSAARAHMQEAALTSASESVDLALQLQPESPAALQIRRDIEVRRSISRWLENTERHLADDEFSEAAQAADEVLKIEPAHEAALLLKCQAEQGARDARAQATVDEARQRCAAGDLAAAQEMLEGFDEPHDLIASELASVETAIQQKRESFELLASRARSQLERGDRQGARDPVREALEAPGADAGPAESEVARVADPAPVVPDRRFNRRELVEPPAPESATSFPRTLFAPPVASRPRLRRNVMLGLVAVALLAVSAGLWWTSPGSGEAPADRAPDIQGIDSGAGGPDTPMNGPPDAVPDPELPFADLIARLADPPAASSRDRRPAAPARAPRPGLVDPPAESSPDPTPPARTQRRRPEILQLLIDAVAAESAGNLDRAVAIYDRALAIEPGNPLALEQRQRIQASIRRPAARELLRQANVAFDAGRYGDARRMFQDAFNQDPSPEATAGLNRVSNVEALMCQRDAICGGLLIRVTPAAEIFVDDRFLGTTAALELRLAAGHHRLRLETEEWRIPRVVDITAGEIAEINVDLELDGFPR